MADDAKKPAAAQASPSDKDLLPQEKDVLFQAQMAVANFFLGYYKYAGFVAVNLNALLGTRFRLAQGYPGGNEINLGVERGEVHGRCGWSYSSVVSTRADWFKDPPFMRSDIFCANDEGIRCSPSFARRCATIVAPVRLS